MEKIILNKDCYKMSDYDLLDLVQKCVQRLRYQIAHNYNVIDVLETYRNTLITCCVAKACLESYEYKYDIAKTVGNCFRKMLKYYLKDGYTEFVGVDVWNPVNDLYLYNDSVFDSEIVFYI